MILRWFVFCVQLNFHLPVGHHIVVAIFAAAVVAIAMSFCIVTLHFFLYNSCHGEKSGTLSPHRAKGNLSKPNPFRTIQCEYLSSYYEHQNYQEYPNALVLGQNEGFAITSGKSSISAPRKLPISHISFFA